MKVNLMQCISLVALLSAPSYCYNGCPDVDHMDHTDHLPHPTDCNLFYRCDHGYPTLDKCPAGLHFNPTLQVCDWPDQAGCKLQSTCTPLGNTDNSYWSPASCNTNSGTLNDQCNIVCKEGFDHSGGSVVTCKENGWINSFGENQLPTCFLTADLGELIVDKINETLNGRPANLLFLLDESGSVDVSEFVMEIRFTKALVSAFPLSLNRSGGVITFASGADVDISLDTDDTCSFITQTDQIRYSSGGTNILAALQLALNEISRNAPHKLSLVFLITDGQSADPTVAADEIKANGDALFTIGIAGFSPQQLSPLASLDQDGKPLFFGIDSFEIFEKVASYLEETYSTEDLHCYDSVPA